MGRDLDAREYKLLLDPRTFEASPDVVPANEFWTLRIRDVVQLIDPNAKPFEQAVHRIIRFWDTPNCDLTNNKLILRTREEASPDFAGKGKLEVTLKFRMPDQFIVGSTSFVDDGDDDVETEFEEDIGPLELMAKPKGQEAHVVIASKLSTRNRFSLSSTYKGPPSVRPNSLGELFAVLPGAAGLVTVSPAQADVHLVPGPTIYEYAFKRSVAELGNNTEAKFTLSYWCFDSHPKKPDVVELSFKCKTPEGSMSGRTARQAYNLFINFQKSMSDIVYLDHNSKTALSLPRNCGG